MLRTLINRLNLPTWHAFHGGVSLPPHKDTAASPIRTCPLPEMLVIALGQHKGGVCAPVVAEGERVLRGQKIGDSQDTVSAPVHSPVCGRVVKIEAHPVPAGPEQPCVFIEPDGDDARDASLRPIKDYRRRKPAGLCKRIRDAGIVGLGGGGFPTHIKLAGDEAYPVETLILNGIECEPYLTGDHRLMLEYADEVVAGLHIMMHVCGTDFAMIALDDTKPDVLWELDAALKHADMAGRVEVHVLPANYPQGSERQLIETLTGRQVPAGRLPMHAGALCHNAATAKAVHDAVVLGQPLTERVFTVGGDAAPKPANLRVAIGTPIDHVLACQGLTEFDGVGLIHGGPMMGDALPDVHAPVVKTSIGLLAMHRSSLSGARAREEPCIRCSHCVQVCPAGLVPNELYRHCRDGRLDRAREYALSACIECGCCNYVCPSRIPLVQYFRGAKAACGGEADAGT